MWVLLFFMILHRRYRAIRDFYRYGSLFTNFHLIPPVLCPYDKNCCPGRAVKDARVMEEELYGTPFGEYHRTGL